MKKDKYVRKLERRLGASVSFDARGRFCVGGEPVDFPDPDHPIWDEPATNVAELADLIEKARRI